MTASARANGSVTERMRLWRKARANGATLRAPFRLPTPPNRHPSRQISIGRGTYVAEGCWFNMNSPSARLVIGEYCQISRYVTFTCGGLIELADHAWIGQGTNIIDQSHDFESWARHAVETGQRPVPNWDMTDPEPVKVGQATWIGANVGIMAGVTIGDGAVVGINSVVTGDIEPFTVNVGVPARPIRSLR